MNTNVSVREIVTFVEETFPEADQDETKRIVVALVEFLSKTNK